MEETEVRHGLEKFTTAFLEWFLKSYVAFGGDYEDAIRHVYGIVAEWARRLHEMTPANDGRS